MSPICSPWCSRHGNGRCLATAYWTFSSYGRLEGGESTLDLCYASPEKNSGVTASTSRHWRPHESSMWRWFHIAGKCHTGHGVALPGCGGGLGLGVGLAGCRFLCALKYTAPFIKHEWSGPQHWGSWGRYVSVDPVHDLVSVRGHEWLATCVPVQDVLSQGILGSSTTCGISGCSEEAMHVTASWW